VTKVKDDLLLYGKNAAELLARWDRGESIWSVEMGGLGPGYEQTLQVAAVEIVRDWLGKELPEKPTPDWADETLKRIDQDLQLSGAQAGAAQWLAYHWLREGPAALVWQHRDAGKEDRLIQVSNHWPRVTQK
jgi:hypothetical protein